jgi:hypothetical protein
MLADGIDQLGPGQTARVDGLLNVLDFLCGELASGQNLWRSVSDHHAAAPKRPPYHLKTVFACPLLFRDKKFLQVGLSCSNFTGSRTMRQSCFRGLVDAGKRGHWPVARLCLLQASGPDCKLAATRQNSFQGVS